MALSSGGLPSAVAVVRLSGPLAGQALLALTGVKPRPRLADLRTLVDPHDGGILDRALVLWFPAPASYTGEDLAELHLHGGPAVVQAILAVLTSMDGIRLAEAGEFTRRALLNDKVDLTEAEGIGDLIAAETDAQRLQAAQWMAGEASRILDGWRAVLIRCRAMIEADLDFADEDDVPDSVASAIWEPLQGLKRAMDDALQRAESGERLRRGVQIALMGRPNAGKSRLLNAIARRDVAIVTEEAGTTRDILEVHLNLKGYPVTMLDTAGLRVADGIVEREGMRRAMDRGRSADLVLWLWDGASDRTADPDPQITDSGPVWFVENKIDLSGHPARIDSEANSYTVSAATGAGLDQLIEQLALFASLACGDGRGGVITRLRHRNLIEEASKALDAVLEMPGRPIELVAEDLRAASDAIGRMTGAIGVEDLLDVVFSEFCIGK